ncbi:hypothetical protein [Chitinophaga pinensis]|uniref:Uncharacterized protein n=1 Tax=Chitinophaga pinensis (strain ATCC 43595 / DSM 2588 / LMG 13176 / NBRC 15968 / NCIMB 11800 / UQM 2034) TaxID=485918 RepID=A0A979GTS7_CHIPD|nr:hypothetical protein [Chitinophaga pinensis]ACU60289.1 hypothetical protein Cpin_2810 [Chitinophaga pinensis DSM 2588]
MAYKRKGHLTTATERWKHLRPLLHRIYWKKERKAGKTMVRLELAERQRA